MKLAVFSDSHGRTTGMVRIVRAVQPDLILHLGDHAWDADVLKKEFPHTPLKAVRGNCDFGSSVPETETFYCESVQVMMTHGHRYHVKTGLDSLLLAAQLSGAGLVLYGHTHIPQFRQFGNLHVLNPGTAGQGPRRTWALVEILPSGVISCRICELEE